MLAVEAEVQPPCRAGDEGVAGGGADVGTGAEEEGPGGDEKMSYV